MLAGGISLRQAITKCGEVEWNRKAPVAPLEQGGRGINQDSTVAKAKGTGLKAGYYGRDDVQAICVTRGKLRLKLGRFGEGVEGRDSFDEAGDGEGVEDAAGFADEMEHATFAAEGNRHANQCGDAGAVNLRHAVEIDDDSARAFLENRTESGGELIAGIANGQAAVEVKNADAVLFVDVDFNGSVLSHMVMSGFECKFLISRF